MKIRTAVALALFALSLPLAPGIALAQGDKPAAPPAMSEAEKKAAMEAMMKAATPGEHHKQIQNLVGDWTYSMKMWMAPGEPPMESSGTMHAESILGGRYVHSVYRGEFLGRPFEGHGMDGYDNAAGKYVSSFVDNAGTGMMYSTGTCDEGCKTLTMISDPMVDPASGQKSAAKQVIRWTDSNHFSFEMYMLDPSGGQGMKVMELTAKRK